MDVSRQEVETEMKPFRGEKKKSDFIIVFSFYCCEAAHQADTPDITNTVSRKFKMVWKVNLKKKTKADLYSPHMLDTISGYFFSFLRGSKTSARELFLNVNAA